MKLTSVASQLAHGAPGPPVPHVDEPVVLVADEHEVDMVPVGDDVAGEGALAGELGAVGPLQDEGALLDADALHGAGVLQADVGLVVH